MGMHSLEKPFAYPFAVHYFPCLNFGRIQAYLMMKISKTQLSISLHLQFWIEWEEMELLSESIAVCVQRDCPFCLAFCTLVSRHKPIIKCKFPKIMVYPTFNNCHQNICLRWKISSPLPLLFQWQPSKFNCLTISLSVTMVPTRNSGVRFPQQEQRLQ